MKIPKTILLIDIIIKLGITVALIMAAATKQQYSYYNFIRWLVMIPFIYFSYKAYQKKQFGLLIYFGLVAILFNPFHKFWFQKQTWHLIDYLIASITALTIIFDLVHNNQSSKQTTK